jgi:predicted NBD/HSP70 family sugar kinase
MPEQFAIGVDIGGTKIAAGLVDTRGQIVMHTRWPMVARKSAKEGLAAVLCAIKAVRVSEAARSLRPAARAFGMSSSCGAR